MADGSGPIHAAARLNSVIGFAGGGGSSVGYQQATGRAPSLAANHWLTAVLAHQRHFPETEHYCADIYDVDPMAWRPHEPIRFGWFSPDCTDHSKAKGSAPKSERIRGLAWSVIPWAKTRRVQTIMVENVEEIVQWGPVYRCPEDWRAEGVKGEVGQPIKALRGVTFKLWERYMAQAGYWGEHRELNAADYGGATTRKRFYYIGEWVGVERVTRIALGLEPSPIAWPAPTHAPRKKAEALDRRPWRGFCEVADWSQPCPSIFLTQAEVDELRRETGRRVQRPLVKATMRRIYRGTDRYVLSAAEPFIVPITHAGDERTHDVRDPLRTVTSAKGGEFALVDPTLALISNMYTSNTGGGRGDPREPAKTILPAHHSTIVTAHLAGLAHGDHERGAGDRVRGVDEPIPTVSAGGGNAAIVAGSLVRTNFHSAAERNGIHDLNDPLRTITGDGGFGIAGAYMVPRYGERPGQAPRVRDVEEPMATVVPKGNGGDLAAVSLHQLNTRDVGAAAGDPLRTVAGTEHQAVQSALLIRQFGSSVGGRDVAEPLGAVMPCKGLGGKGGGGKDQFVAAYLAQGNKGMPGRCCYDPATTVTGRGTQQQLVSAHIGAYYGAQHGSDAADPMLTATGKDRHALTMAWLEQANTGMVGHAAGEPMSTIVGKGCTQRLIEARLELEGGPIGRRGQVLEFLWSHAGVPTEAEWADPAATLAARRKFGLVILGGQVWMIVDIGLRMLTVRELAAAMGLPPEHDLSVDATGRAVSKTHQTQMIGNMVHPDPCAALIRAQCPDLVQPPEIEKAAA